MLSDLKLEVRMRLASGKVVRNTMISSEEITKILFTFGSVLNDAIERFLLAPCGFF